MLSPSERALMCTLMLQLESCGACVCSASVWAYMHALPLNWYRMLHTVKTRGACMLHF